MHSSPARVRDFCLKVAKLWDCAPSLEQNIKMQSYVWSYADVILGRFDGCIGDWRYGKKANGSVFGMQQTKPRHLTNKLL